MEQFGRFYLDKEKDLVVDLYRDEDELRYVLRTPNHGTGNLIANLASLCDLELQADECGLRVIRGTLPCYIDGSNRMVYIFRLLDTKVANIYTDGRIERKAYIPAIAKTLMSQTKDYRQDFRKTVVKTYILRECKFRTDLHTHMNANLDPDVLIALGIHHQIRYPLYYIRKLGLRLSPKQERLLATRRTQTATEHRNSPLRGKYLERRIDDGTFLNFASLILENLENAAWNIPKIRASLAIMKDGQAVFTNLEKVYLYRYVFCKGVPAEDPIQLIGTERITFTIRIHAGESDGLRDNVANAIRCVREGLAPDQPMPLVRIGHGLYTRNLASNKGRELLEDLRNSGAVLEFQITSNVRLNNLSQLERHPLRQYLAAGVPCVQGTDGGAVYGTNTIDEQLALQKMLNLSKEELVAMRHAEDMVRSGGLSALEEKMRAFVEEAGTEDVEAFYAAKMLAQQPPEENLLDIAEARDSAVVFSDRIEELPCDRVPVIIVGGSFNNDRHLTRRRREICALLDDVLAKGDPNKMFLVIGHSLSGYEQYLAERNLRKFDIYAFVPARIGLEEAKALKQAGVHIRVSIEPSPMGIYKSVAYEVFKRRPSVLVALDGNSSGANMIQDAKNGKRRCHIFVLNKRGVLREKARGLEGYASLFGANDDLAGLVCDAVETCYPERWLRQ